MHLFETLTAVTLESEGVNASVRMNKSIVRQCGALKNYCRSAITRRFFKWLSLCHDFLINNS